MPKITEFESDPGLEALQEAVGGYIEVVPRFTKYKGRKCTALCDEEGKLKGYEVNLAATNEWWEQCPFIIGQDELVGDIAIVYGKMT